MRMPAEAMHPALLAIVVLMIKAPLLQRRLAFARVLTLVLQGMCAQLRVRERFTVHGAPVAQLAML